MNWPAVLIGWAVLLCLAGIIFGMVGYPGLGLPFSLTSIPFSLASVWRTKRRARQHNMDHLLLTLIRRFLDGIAREENPPGELHDLYIESECDRDRLHFLARFNHPMEARTRAFEIARSDAGYFRLIRLNSNSIDLGARRLYAELLHQNAYVRRWQEVSEQTEALARQVSPEHPIDIRSLALTVLEVTGIQESEPFLVPEELTAVTLGEITEAAHDRMADQMARQINAEIRVRLEGGYEMPTWMEPSYFRFQPMLYGPAHDNSIRLLKENLSPQQLAEYQANNYFHVIGSDSKTRYRIYCAPGAFNVVAFDSADQVQRLLCFNPGDLPLGDCLLTQKIYLENCEADVARVANFSNHALNPV